ncbi:TAXI family TRAP transporter solute-binding subunit [Mariluticola halotolerans]|uniref:TAXI family TRAP transporter solute-binding subunit n=1 Tax=Mariluticola halotolerans TaxID=2909283 RepID=UPI0026E4485E|nr:TAXI family TRAP transporter solute-binding subunit [Mariluticola halotolerans]UJQ93810.1 TAXI family TRAP transporter solute-binding subunit [Mariluticola halotolerans]
MNWQGIKAVALAGVMGVCAMAPAVADNRYTLATNPQGTIYYTIGGGVAAALQDALGKQVTLQPFTGSSVYIPMIGAGEVSMGLNSSLDLGDWYTGESGTATDLRVLARLWPLRVGFVARADLGVTSVSELEGKRVVTDFSALSAMSKLNVAMLKLSGLDTDKVDAVRTAGLGPGMEGLTEGSLDVTSIAVGIPLTQQAQATIPGGIRYLSVDGEGATSAAADELYAGMYLTVVEPSPRLPEVTEPVTVGGFDVFLTVSPNLPDEDATAILAALSAALPQLKIDYPALGGASVEALSKPTNTVPYHPAAVAYFKEQGQWSDENAARDAKLAR